ncbi:MAG TPA: carboxypeptidase regulatory-like domain-containing protein [Kofleriaceae bacterium]|nr:carboxypeptidase regulatory-like domain-containing protein [Kofleriaceae bacterium]
MKLRMFPVGMAAACAVLACATPAQNAAAPAAPKPSESRSEAPSEADEYGPQPAAAPATAPAARAPTPAAAPRGPVGERAQLLREAADQLDKAQAALDSGNRNLAEQLFSTAELLVGADVLAPVASKFRDGAPPRITTPTQRFENAPPQPRVAGSSETEDEKDRVPPPRVEASLTGTLQIDGRPATGAFGLITLEPTDGRWKPRTPKHVVLEQRNREFLPHVMAISVGSTVAFPNFDPVFHNVFSTSPAAQFDLGLYKSNEAREFTFQKEGIVRLGCNLHANMSAFIAVVAAPAYVVTDGDGRFAFKRLPPGKYKLKAWSERSTAPITQELAIRPGKNTVNLGVTGDAPRGPQPDKFGGKRG